MLWQKKKMDAKQEQAIMLYNTRTYVRIYLHIYFAAKTTTTQKMRRLRAIKNSSSNLNFNIPVTQIQRANEGTTATIIGKIKKISTQIHLYIYI